MKNYSLQKLELPITHKHIAKTSQKAPKHKNLPSNLSNPAPLPPSHPPSRPF